MNLLKVYIEVCSIKLVETPPPLFIEVYAPSQEMNWSCIQNVSVLWVYIVTLFLRSFIGSWTCMFCFSFYYIITVKNSHNYFSKFTYNLT